MRHPGVATHTRLQTSPSSFLSASIHTHTPTHRGSLVVLRRDAMDAAEADFYEALYTQSQAQFDSYVDMGTLLNVRRQGRRLGECTCRVGGEVGPGLTGCGGPACIVDSSWLVGSCDVCRARRGPALPVCVQQTPEHASIAWSHDSTLLHVHESHTFCIPFSAEL